MKIKTVRYPLHDGRVEGRFRAVFLTDLHSRRYGEGQRELLRAIDAAEPDIVLIGGDMMTVKKGRPADLAPLEELLAGLAGRYPVYYALGNHEQRMLWREDLYGDDYKRLRRLLSRTGATLLSNRSEVLDNGICLTGMRMPGQEYAKGRKHGGKSIPSAKITSLDENYYNVCLVHSPAAMEGCAELGADLVLTGHYHGGVMRLPRGLGLVTPQVTICASGCWGMRVYGKTRHISGAGLGGHPLDVRIFNPHELVVAEWNM